MTFCRQWKQILQWNNFSRWPLANHCWFSFIKMCLSSLRCWLKDSTVTQRSNATVSLYSNGGQHGSGRVHNQERATRHTTLGFTSSLFISPSLYTCSSGSHIENWHSVLRNGLVNASYTKLQVRNPGSRLEFTMHLLSDSKPALW